jgi:Fe-S cluster assembly iron-binding protein IscA|tara:strand:- start:3 stop:413 length:411 start_codon:yes stop_codon:yes gene_type:complete
MSTRSNIIIKNGKTNILLYRHWDGYLEGAGQDLHDDLISSNFAIEDKENFNISKFLNKLLEDGSSYRIDDQLGGDIEFLYTFQFEDTYEHGDHYNRVKLKSIEVDQDHQYGRGGKKKYKTLSEFQDDINKARKENS